MVISIGVRYCDAVAFFVSSLMMVANWSKVIWTLYQHQLVENFVEKDQATIPSPLAESRPFKVVKHGLDWSGIGSVSVLIQYPSGGTVLYSLQFVNVFGSVGIPYCGRVLQVWSYQGLVGSSFQGGAGDFQVSFQKSETSVGFIGDVINMTVPAQVF